MVPWLPLFELLKVILKVFRQAGIQFVLLMLLTILQEVF